MLVNTKIVDIKEEKSFNNRPEPTEEWIVKIMLDPTETKTGMSYRKTFRGFLTINIEKKIIKLSSNISDPDGYNSTSSQDTPFEVDMPTKRVLQKITSIYGISDIDLPRFK